MPNIANVSVGKPKVAGAVFRAPLDTALPTDASTALAEAFKDMGYASDDGVVNSNEAETNEIKSWGGKTVLVVNTGNSDKFKLTLIESTNINVLRSVFGTGNVTLDAQSGAMAINVSGLCSEKAVWVLDVQMNAGWMKRIVIPCGTLSELGDVTYKDDEAIAYEITINALPDDSGNTHYEYMAQAS